MGPQAIALFALAAGITAATLGCGEDPSVLGDADPCPSVGELEGGSCTDLPVPTPALQHAPVTPISVDLGALPPPTPSGAGRPDPPGEAATEELSPGVVVDAIDEDERGHPFDKPAPDPDVAAGPDHLIAVVNSAFQIFDKTGTVLHGPRSFDSLFGTLAGCGDRIDVQGGAETLYDPRVLYDEELDRFLIGNLHIAKQPGEEPIVGAAYCVAATATGDPLGVWHLYRFPMDLSAPGEVWLDFPQAGIGREAIYMGGNLNTATSAQAGRYCFVEARVWAFDRAAVMAGAPAAFAERGLGIEHKSPQALHLHGFAQGTWPTDGPHHLLTHDLREGPDGGSLALFSWSDPFGASGLLEVAKIDMDELSGIAPIPGLLPLVPQPELHAGEGPTYLFGNSSKPLDFEYRNGFGWTSQNVPCDFGGTWPLSCIRWAQIHLETGTVVQHGVIPATDVEGRVYPDLAVNRCNDMAIAYTLSSESFVPGLWYTGRRGSDPLGTTRPEAELRESDLVFRGGEIDCPFPSVLLRWGDYFGMTVDPDGDTFWFLGQYSKDLGATFVPDGTSSPIPVGSWGTVLSSLSFPAGGACASACSNGVDDDEDGEADFPLDPGCDGPLDESELSTEAPCDDGVDNDGDGLVDFDPDPGEGDPGCGAPLSAREDPACDDDRDNDGDGGIDWDGDPEARGDGPGEADPECVAAPWRGSEAPYRCGLGVELALVLLPLLPRLKRSSRSATASSVSSF